jgi:hypothetical protein
VSGAARELARGGVRGILNFASCAAPALPGVHAKNLDLTLFLEALSFQIGSGERAS